MIGRYMVSKISIVPVLYVLEFIQFSQINEMRLIKNDGDLG